MTNWEHPHLAAGQDFDEVWSRQRDDSILFIAGAGFDPRATVVLERLVASSGRTVDGVLIEMPESSTDPDVRKIAAANRERFTELVGQSGGSVRAQPLPEFHDPEALGRLISREFQRSRATGRGAQSARVESEE